MARELVEVMTKPVSVNILQTAHQVGLRTAVTDRVASPTDRLLAGGDPMAHQHFFLVEALDVDQAPGAGNRETIEELAHDFQGALDPHAGCTSAGRVVEAASCSWSRSLSRVDFIFHHRPWQTFFHYGRERLGCPPRPEPTFPTGNPTVSNGVCSGTKAGDQSMCKSRRDCVLSTRNIGLLL